MLGGATLYLSVITVLSLFCLKNKTNICYESVDHCLQLRTEY